MSNNGINLNSTIQRNEERFLANSLGDEMVMMDMESGDYLGINSVGVDIWNLLEKPATVNQLLEQMLALYDIDAETCQQEVIKFLTQMQQQQMVTIA
jgi:hypothetical protein